MKFDLNSNTQVKEVIVLDESVSSDVQLPAAGSGIDISEFRGIGLIVLMAKNIGGDTDETLDVSVLVSSDDSTYAAPSPAIAFAQVEDGRAFLVQSIDFDALGEGNKFLALNVDVAGTTPDYAISALLIANPQNAPQTRDTANTT